MTLQDKIKTALQQILPDRETPIGLHEPSFAGNEWLYVKDCLDSGWVSSVGKYVDLFEQRVAEFVGVKKAIAVVNGTAALHIILKLIGTQSNEEVLMPSLTFVATANAVSYCNAVPHFIDSEEKSLGVDPLKLEDYLKEIAELRGNACYNKITGKRIRALLVMHAFGHSVDLDPLIDICERYNLILVEDAAESLGTYYKGIHTGGFGKASAISFNGNKILTTGGGGAILTNDEQFAARAKHLTTTAKVPHQWRFFHDVVGYNYRMPNINAAIGCGQLEQLPVYIEKKRHLAELYKQAFWRMEGVKFFVEPEFSKSNYWLNVLLLDEEYASELESILTVLNHNGWMARPAWEPLHTLPMYSHLPRMNLSCAESIARRLINIPSSAYLVP